MRKFLEKTEVTFAVKISVLLMLVLFASSLKEKNNQNNLIVKNISIELPTVVFAKF